MTALIFDLDGVVADTSAAHYRSWQRLADEEGVVFDPRANIALLGRTRDDSLALFLGERVIDAATKAEWLARKQAYFLVELGAMGPDDALPGVVPLLHEARAASLPTALASSSSNARAVLAQLGIASLFDVVGDGRTVARPKPAPDIFLWAADQLGLAPAHCIVFEDSAAGIAAAKAGGFPVIGIGREADTELHFGDLAGVSLADVLRLAKGSGEPR